jgi:cytochrome c553
MKITLLVALTAVTFSFSHEPALLYKALCQSCHSWEPDADLDEAPPLQEVLSRYGTVSSLKNYLLEPVPVQPEKYEAMENPELSDEEAQSIAEYLLERMKTLQ